MRSIWFEEGYNAFDNGNDLNSCPYTANTVEWSDWVLGWNASCELDKQTLEDLKDDDFFNQGYDACVDEKSKDECPYPDSSPERDAWLDGWECAEEEYFNDDED